MGAYAYCEKCDSPLGRPTPAEAVRGVRLCDCGAEHPVSSEEAAQWLSEFLGRIEALEKHVWPEGTP